jgi:hypothetical protein
VDTIEAVNKANLKRLNEKDLRALENSENVSQHFKKQAFEVLTNRNKTEVKKERFGTSHRNKKHKEV